MIEKYREKLFSFAHRKSSFTCGRLRNTKPGATGAVYNDGGQITSAFTLEGGAAKQLLQHDVEHVT